MKIGEGELKIASLFSKYNYSGEFYLPIKTKLPFGRKKTE